MFWCATFLQESECLEWGFVSLSLRCLQETYCHLDVFWYAGFEQLKLRLQNSIGFQFCRDISDFEKTLLVLRLYQKKVQKSLRVIRRR